MRNILDFVRDNKVKILIALVIVILIGVGIYKVLELKKKEYTITEVSKYNYFVLNKDSKYGVINATGKIIIEPIYDNIKIPNPEKAVFICKESDRYIALNDLNEKIFNQYEEVDVISINGIVSNIPYEKTVLKYKKDGKYGIINFEGKAITKPIYEEIDGLEKKESELLVRLNGKYGVINVRGAKLIKPEYDNIVADGFYTDRNKYGLSGYIVSNKTTEGYRYGYINYKYKKILDVEYNSIERILNAKDEKDTYLIASKNGKYGVVKNSKVLINYSYQGIEYDNDNSIFEIEKNDKYGVMDANGKIIIPIEYIGIEIAGIYIQAYKEDENITTYNMTGEKLEDVKYASVTKTQNINYQITINEDGFYGIINQQNEELVPNKYNYIEYLFEDYFIVSNESGKLGVINSKEEVKLDLKYDVLQKIENTNVIEAKILKDKMSDFYSYNLDLVYRVKDAYIYKEDGYLKIYSKEQDKYLDFNGKIMEVKEVLKNNTLIPSKKDNKWGFVDKNENVVVEYKYDKVTEFNEYGYAGIRVNDKWGVIDSNGNIVKEPIYENLETNSNPEFLGEFYKVYYGYGEFYYTDK